MKRKLLVLLPLLVGILALTGCADAQPVFTGGTPLPTATILSDAPALPTFTPTPQATPTPLPITVGLDPALPQIYVGPLLERLQSQAEIDLGGQRHPLVILTGESGDAGAQVTITFGPLAQAGRVVAERFYAVAVPFTTVQDAVSLDEVTSRWQGKNADSLLISQYAGADLAAILGGTTLTPTQAMSLPGDLAATPGAWAVLPFQELDPTFKVLTVEGESLLDNRLDPATYALAVAVSVQGEGEAAQAVADLLAGAIQPASNRDASRLTSLIMTGVTAMSRGTAAAMEAKGYTYPALVISDTLAAADITHVSNEVPFIEGCEVRNYLNQLQLCSDYPYWDALEAIGADIVGLSGNHVNDFGREGAVESITFYRDRGIPIYGSGLNLDEACAPLLWEHNGNTFAFMAVLAWEPASAWASDSLPGACYYYDHKQRVLDMITELSGEVDVVAVEIQYYEAYTPYPTPQQIVEFREIRAAGADIMTGVQSHVPQALEPYGVLDEGGSGIIVYGLGNLFFDQMERWDTRTELYARHAIYDGRLLSTQILTGILEDFAQPRWTTPAERADLLRTIFGAAPDRQ